MDELKSFIENKIKTAETEIENIENEIRKKAQSLVARKEAKLKELLSYQSLLKEFERSKKAQKPNKASA